MSEPPAKFAKKSDGGKAVAEFKNEQDQMGPKRQSGGKCEDCLTVVPHFGLRAEPNEQRPGRGNRRWCSRCAKSHDGSYNLDACRIPMCEDCAEHKANHGLSVVPGQKGKPRDMRWCTRCAGAHAGAERWKTKVKCEDCSLNDPHFYHPGDPQRRKRWCSSCAKSHGGVLHVMGRRVCEDCKKKQSTYGLLSELSLPGRTKDSLRRWCSSCAKEHPGAVDVKNKRCEDWWTPLSPRPRAPPAPPKHTCTLPRPHSTSPSPMLAILRPVLPPHPPPPPPPRPRGRLNCVVFRRCPPAT